MSARAVSRAVAALGAGLLLAAGLGAERGARAGAGPDAGAAEKARAVARGRSAAALPAALAGGDVIAWAASRSHVVLARAGGVFFVDLATGAEIRLPGVLAAPAELRFSPRGDRVALSLRVGPTSDVYLLDLTQADGPRLHRLTLHGGGDPRWLGRGERLLYQAPDGAGGFGLFVRDEGGLGPARDFWNETPAPRPIASVVT